MKEVQRAHGREFRPASKGRRGPRQTIGRGDALLIIDVINDLAFPGGEKVLPWAERLSKRLRAFRGRMHTSRLPVIYANDNFGIWHGSFSDVYTHCTRKEARGRYVAA